MAPAPDEPENLVLVFLRRLDTGQAELHRDNAEIKQRLSLLEGAVAGLRRDIASLAETDALHSGSSDRVAERLTRIERRLDIIPG
jgi:hypothetical protein